MKTNNRRWGARRIVGQLRKLGKIISKSTVLNIPKESDFPDWSRLRSALKDIKDCPKFIVSDRDGIYGEWVGTFLKDCYDITLCPTSPCMPNCNAFIERWNSSVHEELLDHRIVFGEPGLRSLLKEYVEYFNQIQPHQSLEQNLPCKKHGKIDFDRTKIQRERLVDGLIVDYSIAA